MSLYGALFSGVSGLQSQSSAMGAIADNVTNVNTVGYKGTKVNFQTLVTHQVSLSQYSPGGVQSVPRTGVDVQGLLQATTSSTDVGISGQGFFVVSSSATDPTGYAYTRAGSYGIDKDGFLQNVSGFYMQGWPLETWDGTTTASTVSVNNQVYMKSYRNQSGDTYYINSNAVDSTNLQPLNLSTIGGTARATSTISMGLNLPSGAAIGATSKTNVPIFDSLGSPHNLDYQWTKRAQNVWDCEVTPPAGSRQVTLESQRGETYFSAGRLDFTSIPAAGSSMDMTIGGTTYNFNFTAAADTVTTLANAGAAGPAFNIDVSGGRTLSQVIDSLAMAVESATRNEAVTDYGVAGDGRVSAITGKGSPTLWAERVSGENALIFRNAFTQDLLVDVSNPTGTPLLDSAGQPCVVQVNPRGANGLPGNNWAVNGLTLRDNSASPLANETDWRGAWINRTAGTAGAAGIVSDATSRDYSSALGFNGDGTIDTIFGYNEMGDDDPRLTVNLDWANGALNMDGGTVQNGGGSAISVFWGNYNAGDGVTQRNSSYQLGYISQNGNKFGNFSGVSISEDGVVTAQFDNGVTTPIFMIPIATFVNVNGMNSLTGNVFQETTKSGLPTIREAGSAGAGKVNQSVLEASTVDLGTEFTNMITTQRAYSASAKIITTADEMLDELVRIKR
ncbi:flagellar hook protein FlgE [Pararhodospirillum oryzae]|uniref:Flagellar hook protein FlgE n=1 Tax=Pararhodospirillum oryzae TaxID=478448 RepID=A0A512H866_9PROT|nr:flagellar hook-basal body complex protein [Pararhodospirillum oryzae]GEO81618.1 flagellar hook protein FlgE [Pararhodospirillum oryzae]